VDGDPTAQWDWWIAGVVAGLVAYRWRSAGITVLVGMATVWALGTLS
jgi:branched-subunit amino acid transport protein